MLRDEASGSPALHAVLGQYDISEELIDVVEFHKLTANSYLWKLRMTDFVYFLYAEDFVESLEQVTDTLRIATDGAPGELAAAKVPMVFETAGPVTATSVYQKPADFDSKIAHYAVESGYDFVFLFRTEEKSDKDFNELA